MESVIVKPWVPLPLRPWFWIPLVVIMACGGIAFEVALHFSQKKQGVVTIIHTNHCHVLKRAYTGWATNGNFTSQGGFLHYVYVSIQCLSRALL